MLKHSTITVLQEIISQGFDVYGFDQNAKEDRESIEKASQLRKISLWSINSSSFIQSFLVNRFIEEEIKNGIPAERIVSCN